MKIPYIKIYTADLLAKTRRLTPEQIGNALIGICEVAFENESAYKPQNEAEEAFFNLLLEWKSESMAALKQKRNAGKNGAKKRWYAVSKKTELSDGSTAISSANGIQKQKQKQSSITTYREGQPAGKESLANGLCAKAANSRPAQGETGARVKTPLQLFSNAVLSEFEDEMNDTQKGIWFKRNCRCLTDILNFCGKDIPLAVATVGECVERLEKAGLSGGYEAVCRNLPEYYAAAKKKLEVKHAKNAANTGVVRPF